MAKAPKKTASTLNLELLAAIGSGSVGFVSQADGLPLLQNNPPLIEVNITITDPNDATKAAVRLTAAGAAMVAGQSVAPVAKSKFEIITGAVLPPSKRGNKGGGAPTQYPFDALEVGQTFFVPKSDEYPNPVKKMQSSISSANARYAVATGETKSVMRTKRGPGNKAVKDAAGVNVKEQKDVAVKKATRKFTIRAVVTGQVCGTFTAPADGALIGRTV